jgi:hypothetical protein
MRRVRSSRKIPVTPGPSILGGTWVQIGTGEDMELAQVVRSSRKRSAVTLGRWRWYHSAWRGACRFARHPVWRSVMAWCALRGHRLGLPDEDGYACCRCGERWTGDAR